MKNGEYKILLVEDNPDHLSFEKKSIEKLAGISKVITARSAREARAAISDQEFDLIILDYDLPDTDGLVFLESLTDTRLDIPVVMVTGLGNEKIAVQAMKLGAYDYVVKDRDYLKNLPDVINHSLEKLRLSRSLKKMEKQLRESEDRFQQLFENANSGFVSVNLKTGKFIKPNKMLIEITGYSREEILTKEYYEIVDPEDRDRIISYHKNRLAGKWGTESSPLDFEFWLLSKSGKRKYVNCTVTMFPHIQEMFMTLNDITDRKILEEKLQKAHEQLKRHTRELENEVDELKKRLIIEPALEIPTDAEQKYNLDYGCTYLIKESRPVKSYDIFKDFVSHGVFGLVITRTYPKRIQQVYQLEKTPMVWLSKNETEDSVISGSNLGGLLHAITEFVEKSKTSIIILDGLEFLVTVNGFNRCIQFMNDLFEIIMTNEAILVIPVNPEALEPKELAILERSTEEVETVLS